MSSFKALGIDTGFVDSLAELNIKQPTAIQEEVIPLLLSGTKDLVAQAQTGTGKTAAFGLPLLAQVDPNKKEIQALIICPTRELAQQVAKQLFKFTKYTHKIFIESVYGGEKIDIQKARLNRPTHVVVATPGRLIDLVQQNALSLKSVNTVVLDEADEMMSMGFQSELEQILDFIPQVQKKWLFSATMPHAIQQMISKHLEKNPTRVSVSTEQRVNQNISHQYSLCADHEKLAALLSFLKQEGKHQGVIFCKTKAGVQNLALDLSESGINAGAIHGDLYQSERDKVMRAFKNKSKQVLVATDIAARGIDIDGLTYVVHYDLPENEEYYTHRSGRTARGGKEGTSYALALPHEQSTINELAQNLGIQFRRLRD